VRPDSRISAARAAKAASPFRKQIRSAAESQNEAGSSEGAVPPKTMVVAGEARRIVAATATASFPFEVKVREIPARAGGSRRTRFSSRSFSPAILRSAISTSSPRS
jgi:hypothetical protein